MPTKQIPFIMNMIDKIVSPDDRKRKYSDRQIIKVLVLLNMFTISIQIIKGIQQQHEGGYLENTRIMKVDGLKQLKDCHLKKNVSLEDEISVQMIRGAHHS